MVEARGPRAPILLAACVYAGLVCWMFWPSLVCGTSCYIDLPAIHGQLGSFEFADTRLNSWILAWGQKSLLQNPGAIFSANALYPSADSLAGSEHLFGLGLLTWPLRFVTSNAVAIHQTALILSFFLLGLTSYAFVRFFTSSIPLALLAGACAIFMPWRIADLTHIQLLGAQWFPLIWLLALRISLGQERKRDPLILFLVLALQLLTSFYLAYSISLSLFLCIGVGFWIRRPDKKSLPRLVLPVTGAYLLFLLSAIPYLVRARSGLLEVASQTNATPLTELMARSWDMLKPVFQAGWTQAADEAHSYSIPIAIALAAFFSLWRLAPLSQKPPEDQRAIWSATWALWLIVLSSMALMLGPEAQLGSWRISLPARWAASLVPGFENMRAPHRWAIPVSLAAPLLASIGVHSLHARWKTGDASRNRFLLIVPLYAALSILFLVTVPWRQLPAKESFLARPESRAPYEALANLPEGPVLEVPWHTNPVYYVQADSQYMLASTLHWKPITNGFTAHLPPYFEFLRRIAARLPDPEALETFRRLVDVRFIVVHLDRLRARDRARWRSAAQENPDLPVVYDEHQTLVLEIEQTESTGLWQDALTSEERRDTTLHGLSRDPLDSSTQRALLEVAVPDQIREPIAPDLGIPFALRLANRSQQEWPGFDPDPEGLIQVRIAWMSEDGSLSGQTALPVDQDLRPGEDLELQTSLAHPGKAGLFFYCFDLIQKTGDAKRVLTRTPTIKPLRILPPDSGTEAARQTYPDATNTEDDAAWSHGCEEPIVKKS